jgi:hypothetical protein
MDLNAKAKKLAIEYAESRFNDTFYDIHDILMYGEGGAELLDKYKQFQKDLQDTIKKQFPEGTTFRNF